MAALTTWMRIEPHAQTTDLDAGLAAEVADPLWFLLRQLQLGELKGDDGGAPVAVDVQASWARFTRFRAEGPSAPPNAVRIGATTGPIEALVERERTIRVDPGGATASDSWAASIRAGRALSRRLSAAGLGAVALRLATDGATTFAPAPATDDVEGPTDARYRALLAGRTIDAGRVLGLVRGAGLPAGVLDGLGQADRDLLAAELAAWASDVDAEWGIADAVSAVAASWIPDRLEYAFSIAAPPLPGEPAERVLTAREYDGSGVDWYSLDLVPGGSLGAAADADQPPDEVPNVGTRVRTLLASQLSYPGMPADRFWEMEDAAVALGTVGAGPTDLARMLALDFAIVYGPDWFIAPVEVPVGCVARVDWVVVRDTFGVATLVGTTDTQAGDGRGRQFQPSNVDGAEGDNPVLVVLPSSLGPLRSDLREHVAIQRDEAANLAWAIERIVMGPSGRGVEREWFASDFDLPVEATDAPHELVWRLATPVAATWTPLVAARSADGARLLRKARLLETATTLVRGAKSRILADVTELRDEEVTRSGIRVTIVEQLARWHDGRTFAWRGREKRVGRGEVSSGLRFDAATPAKRQP